jgi:hypothetical protein
LLIEFMVFVWVGFPFPDRSGFAALVESDDDGQLDGGAAVRFVRQQLAQCRQVRAASLHDCVTRRRIGSPSTWRNSSAATTVYAARYSCARRDEPDRRVGDRQRVVDITERVLTGSLAGAFILGRLPNASLLGKRCHSNNVWIKFNVRRWSRSQQDSNFT